MVKKHLNKDERIAVTVLIKTKLIRNWAIGEAKSYNIPPGSAGYAELIERLSRELAEKTISQQVTE